MSSPHEASSPDVAEPRRAINRRRILLGASALPLAVPGVAHGASPSAAASLPVGDPDEGLFSPADHGAVGDGVADDTAALQATIDAARAAGGGAVILAGTFRITGPVVFKDGVGARGVAGSQDSTISRIICGSATARVDFGHWASGNDHPGSFRDFTIDGDETGDPSGIARFQCVHAHFENLLVVGAAGDGMHVDSAQNNTWISCNSLSHGGAALVLNNGCGGNTWVRGSYSSSRVSLRITDAPASNGPVYPWPAHNSWYHCIFESYNPDGDTLLSLESGAGYTNRFVGCGIAANGPLQLTEEAIVTVSNTIVPTISTTATFDGCLFHGGDEKYPIFKVSANNGVAVTGSCYFGFSTAVYSGPAAAQWAVDTSSHVYSNCDRRFAEGTGDQGTSQVRMTPAGIRLADDTTVAGDLTVRGAVTRGAAIQFVAGNVTVDAAAASLHKLAITGGSNATLSLTGAEDGRVLTLWWARTGTQTITWPGNVRFAGGAQPAPPTVGNWLCISFIYDGTNSRWLEQHRSVVPS